MLNPLRITQDAVAKFPRWALFAILMAYAIPGLFGRDPWRSDDAIGFGIMWTMAHGTSADALVLNVMGAPFYDAGPMFFWIGAALMRAFDGWIPADELARVPTLLMQALAGVCIWYTTYLLARRPEAQPQPFAFGGHARPIDYGRVLGDAALLFGVATLGLIMRVHESSTLIAQLACASGVMFALVRWLDRPVQGAALFGLASAALVLCGTASLAIVPGVSMAAVLVIARDWRTPVARTWPLALLTAAVPLAMWWWALGRAPMGPVYRAAWLGFEPLSPWAAHPSTWAYYLRNLPWFTWPAWPLAVIAVRTWRGYVRAAHIALPIAGLMAAAAVAAFGHSPADAALIYFVPPLLPLAAFGLPALRRGAANLIDWFALLAFSLFALTIWACWGIAMTGWPAPIAYNFAKLVPGFQFRFEPVAVVLALIITAGWIRAIRWRIVERPNVVWRSTVLSSSGVAFVWMLLVMLGLPYADYLKTYRVVSAELAKHVPAGACVYPDPVGLAQRASFAYFDDIRFGTANCGYVLRHHGAKEVLPPLDPTHWRLIWEGRRPGDRRERITLYRRIEPRATP